MTLEQLCTNKELSKQLKEAGMPQNSLFAWGKERSKYSKKELGWTIKMYEKGIPSHLYAAFTASELGEALPKRIGEIGLHYTLYQGVDWDKGWKVYYATAQKLLWQVSASTEINARAEMLLCLKEKGVIWK